MIASPSRSARFAQSLGSGYMLVAANVLFTLVQWPLALHYLTKEEFGLWAAVTSLAVNLQLLVDMGIAGSIWRNLIDHKDDRSTGGYGTVLKTGMLVQLVQGALVAVIGSLVSMGLPGWMNIAAGLQPIFRQLMIGHCVLFGIVFMARIGVFALQAHQRFDIPNYANLAGFMLNLLILWLCLRHGLGLYSLLAAKAAELIVPNVFCLLAAYKMNLFPARGQWGRANWRTFKEIFSYANDIFLISVGQVLIALSQTPVITIMLGLEANAVWSVMTKVFMLAQTLVARLSDFSAPAFAEMIVRGETTRLRARFYDMVVLTASGGALLCATVALANASFVQIWMHGKFSWPVRNDLLMAFFILAQTVTRCHINLAGLTKRIGVMRYVYLVEGALFVTLGSVLSPRWGLAGIIFSGIVANLLCSGLYGFWRSAGYFGISLGEVAFGWLKLPGRLMAMLLAAAAGLWLATRHLPAPAQFGCDVIGLGGVGTACFWRLGLPEICGRNFAARWEKSCPACRAKVIDRAATPR